MLKTVNIHDTEAHLSQLVDRVAAGEEIILPRDGKPVARLVPLEPKPTVRKLGLLKGKIWIAPDFDAPLPPEVLNDFYDGPIEPPEDD